MRKFVPVILLLVGYTALPILVWVLSSFNFYYDYILTNLNEENTKVENFDFIIVGGGSTGSILANKLSLNNKVLLLEAGGDPLYFNSIPGFASELIHLSQVTWIHKTVPQKYSCWGLVNNSSRWATGKLLGGSSNLNYMLYVHGHPKDYDDWARVTGDESWKYQNIRQYFKKNSELEENKWAPLYELFMNAGRELGYSVNLNLNENQGTGFGPFQLTQKKGKRHGGFEASVEKIRHRQNLKISRYSHATKIQLDKSNRAIGIWYVRHGEKKFVRASKEIILCAGALNSPKLLMLSGIGPKEHLKSLGIKVRVNLPVGKNLQDHIMAMVLNIVIDEPISMIPERDFDFSVLTDYFFRGRGPLTSATGVQGQAFLSTEEVRKSDAKDWPDIQLYLFGVGNFEKMHSEFSRQFNLRPNILSNFTEQARGKDGFILAPALARPKSAGRILLQDKNPFSPLLIDPNYLEDSQDVRALIEGIKLSLNLIENTRAFQKLNARLLGSSLPGCEDKKFRSDEYWECYIRHLTMTLYHPSGTCRMGQMNSDPEAVVDSELRVLGISGLRVADTSVFPNIVNSNTNAAAMMIGEKASFMIRKYWSDQFHVCPALILGSRDLFSTFVPYQCFYSRLV